MIIDKLSNAKTYEGLHPGLKTALQYLQENDLSNLPAGKLEVKGEKLFLLVEEYETKLEEQALFESHNKHIDIQYMVQGEERMGYTHIEHMKVVKEEHKEKDIIYYEGKGEKVDFFLVQEGYFTIFFPQDTHAPGIIVEESKRIKKVIVKVLL